VPLINLEDFSFLSCDLPHTREEILEGSMIRASAITARSVKLSPTVGIGNTNTYRKD
jgi:hypothetical protein